MALIAAPSLCGAVPRVVPGPPTVSAKAYLLQDFDSGRVLAESNADARVAPASLTKIMTSYVVFSELAAGNIHMKDQVVVSEKAWRMPGSRMFIEVGDRVTVEELLHGVIVQSGNDAAVALAEHIAGSEQAFAALMNAHARELGLSGTHFVNAEGLPNPEHYTTARDMAHVTRAMIRRFPKLYRLHSQREFTYNKIPQRNRNRLLWRVPAIDGVKTGYTRSAGYCLVASAEKQGMRLISVVMGSRSAKSRAGESYSLLTYGFRFFETHRLFAARQPIEQVPVWEGAVPSLGLGTAKDLYVTVPRGAFKDVKTRIQLSERVVAPVSQGELRGVLKVTLDGKEIESRHVVALRTVGQGGIFKRLSDKVRLWFQ